MPTTTITETQVPNLQIHVLESEEQFEGLTDIDPDALYFTPFTMLNYAEDDHVVHIADNETIEGTKTFVDQLRGPTPDGTVSSAVVTVGYLNNHGGKIDDVEIVIPGAGPNGTDKTITSSIQQRVATLGLDLSDYAYTDEPIFTGSEPPKYDPDGTGANPVRLTTIDDLDDYLMEIEINNSDTKVSISNNLANLDLSSYVEMVADPSPQSMNVGNSINATTLNNHTDTYFATAASVVNVIYEGDTRLSDTRNPNPHGHSLTGTHADLYLDVDAQSPELLSNYLSRTFAGVGHVHNSLKNNANSSYSASIPNLSQNETIALISDLNAKITYGTSGMTAGSTALATGVLYFQYE